MNLVPFSQHFKIESTRKSYPQRSNWIERFVKKMTLEFYNEFNRDPNEPCDEAHPDEGPDEMFRFIKVMK